MRGEKKRKKANSHSKRGRRTALPGKEGASDGTAAVLIRGAAATLGSDKPLPVWGAHGGTCRGRALEKLRVFEAWEFELVWDYSGPITLLFTYLGR
jgi:hypothetical protein